MQTVNFRFRARSAPGPVLLRRPPDSNTSHGLPVRLNRVTGQLRCQWAHLAIKRLLARLRACNPHRVALNTGEQEDTARAGRVYCRTAVCNLAVQLTRLVPFRRRRRRRCFCCRSAPLPSAVLAVAAVVSVTAFPSVFAAAIPATASLV